MMLDARLRDRDKVVLTRLAFHLNFKTGDLYPSLHLLALELSFGVSEDSSKRAVRRSLEQAEKLGWIERHARHAGYRLNRSNQFRLKFPPEITEMLATREDKSDMPSGQIQHTERTPVSAITSAVVTSVGNEHSVSKDTASFAPRADAINRFDSDESKKGASEKGLPRKTTYDLGDVDAVRDMIECYGHDLNGYRAMSIGGLVECSRQHKQEFDGGALRAMASDGHFGINPKGHLYLLEAGE